MVNYIGSNIENLLKNVNDLGIIDKMDIGIYTNIFEVSVPDKQVEIMKVERGTYPDLRKLRDSLQSEKGDVEVYAGNEFVYGYGPAMDRLREHGFILSKARLIDVPKLTSRMILNGFLEQLSQDGFEKIEGKGRVKVFNFNKPTTLSSRRINLYQGYDLRSIFLFNPEKESLSFGLVIDIAYTFKDERGNSLNTHTVIENFGSNILKEIRQKQGDLLPDSKINSEVSRQRLLEHILPFVNKYAAFPLSCGVDAILSKNPMRVVLASGGYS